MILNSSEEKMANDAGDVLGKAYDDLLHPSAASLGNTLSLIPRTVGVWLRGWEKWVVNGEESIRLTVEATKEKIAKIPEENLREPEPYVAVPAIQQISCCYDSEDLREMYANLLTSSMDQTIYSRVHPSYVDIIKQLTPDEAKLLQALPQNSREYVPVIDLRVKTEGETGYRTLLKTYSTICDDICEHPENVGSYLDNLCRLGIIAIPDDMHIVDEKVYKPLEQSTTITAEKAKWGIGENDRFECFHRLLYVTNFGVSFISCCVYGFETNA